MTRIASAAMTLPNGCRIETDIDEDKLMARQPKRNPDVPNDYDLMFTGGVKSLRIELHLSDVYSMRQQAHAIFRFARQIEEACNVKAEMATRINRIAAAHAECRATCRNLSASQELHAKRDWDGTK